MANLLMEFAQKLFPMYRCLTGDGVRDTLRAIRERLPNLDIHSIPSGTKAFDWTVPDEWKVDEAYIITPEGNKICDIAENNLHLVGYSTAVDQTMNWSELKTHLHYLPDKPDFIPYLCSYYKKYWGFCLSHRQYQTLTDGVYYVKIKSKHFNGFLNLGELYIPGERKEEVFFSTYICHPSLANNEISGPVLATELAEKLLQKPTRLSYRFVFVPETIGSIVYISKNIANLKKNVIAAFNLTCVGDERTYSYLPSRKGDTLADKVAKHVLRHVFPQYQQYTWMDRGSDERQYCSPGVDLPMCSVMRSKYGTYPEYHTSGDVLGTVVTEKGLAGSLDTYLKCIFCLENNAPSVKAANPCEPQLGKYNLYGSLTNTPGHGTLLCDLLSEADGCSLLELADRLDRPFWNVYEDVKILEEKSLISVEW